MVLLPLKEELLRFLGHSPLTSRSRPKSDGEGLDFAEFMTCIEGVTRSTSSGPSAFIMYTKCMHPAPSICR